MAKLKILQFTTFLLILFNLAQSEEQMNSRKLDEITPPDLGNKCGGCPCNNPCLPPPSLPPPSPPPPSPPPPPPKNNPPSSNYCPPPPSGGGEGGSGSGGGGGGGGGGSGSGGGGGGGQYPPNSPYIYINGPPGNLYPVDLSGSGRVFAMGQLPFLITITSVLGVLVI